MSEIVKRLSEQFPVADVRKRPGRGGMELSWVEARVVTDRLNEVLGHDAWSFRCEVVAHGAPSIVKGKLEIFRADGSVSVREDFGYSTGGSGEDLKEAVSDAIRRVASLVGVSSYLYAHSQGSASLQQPNAVILDAPQHQETVNEAAQRMFGDPSDDKPSPLKAAMDFSRTQGLSSCSHGNAWVLKPGGISKTTGREFQPFYSASHKLDDGSWCKDKPSAGWVAAQVKR